ncbi:hypothetical protein ABZ926_14405 [Streptomyces litmocidini]|uniref:hypothetical protein n=1 Tax=Streptomyces litmocidini TaxID=67318 RepID=UPI0033E6C2CC
MDDVAARTAPLPGDVTDLLRTLRERLDELADDEPVVALKTAGKLEAIVADYGSIAARYIDGDVIPLPRLAEALGTMLIAHMPWRALRSRSSRAARADVHFRTA